MNKPFILASTSPRRQELIKLIGKAYDVKVEEVEEVIDISLSPEENVEQLAILKAEAVANKYRDQLVIGADTVVCLEGKIMGKPKNKQEAYSMLRLLSGKVHQVITGVALVEKETNRLETFHETTYVTMMPLSEEEIEGYIETGEPMDKAGAYGIQGKGALYIESIQGDYYNVVGLPVHQLYERLK